MLPRLTPADIFARAEKNTRTVLDGETLATAASIVAEVRAQGVAAVRRYAERFDGFAAEAPLLLDRSMLEDAWSRIDEETRALLERTTARIRAFAVGQKRSLSEFTMTVGGFECGHECVPVRRVGCYAPGGRYPLPSSVLMTVVPARVACVQTVVAASPRPAPVVLAAAFIAGADGVVPVGGAHAIAALAYGAAPIPACDMVVGPGNRFVTAAKHIVSRDVGIDMLAGPSELVVVADASADAELVAADLLAQAEHDDDALPLLVTTCDSLVGKVRSAIERRLARLATASTARTALRNGGAVLCADDGDMAAVCDAIAPEHLAVHLLEPREFACRVAHCGAVFLGSTCGEVLGDYGAGPNHVLPTGRQARHRAGLSVFDFLRVRTFLRAPMPTADQTADQMLHDAEQLARIEGLDGHAESARERRQDGTD